MTNTFQRTTIYLDATDRAAMQQIRIRYGLPTDAAAIRLALRVLAESASLQVIVPPTADQPEGQPA